ncbi:MAG TPA: alpha/beta hydrolase fold domain-containing protein [Candidatus Limnocylindrales bacterium]
MPSWQSRAVITLLRLIRRKRHHRSARAVHARVERLARRPTSHHPHGISAHFILSADPATGWPVYRVGTGTQHEIVYLHGGAYLHQIVRQHWQFIGELATNLPARIIVPIYPLVPAGTAETTVPATAGLLASCPGATVIGDSAGGGLALAATQLLRDTGRRMPRRLVLISPWLDVTMSHPDQPRLARRDPMLDLPGLAEAGRLYAGRLGPEHPFASPLRGGLGGLPPITAFTGTRDLLHPDSVALDPVADVHIGAGLPHVYPILPIPEGATARATITRLIALD